MGKFVVIMSFRTHTFLFAPSLFLPPRRVGPRLRASRRSRALWCRKEQRGSSYAEGGAVSGVSRSFFSLVHEQRTRTCPQSADTRPRPPRHRYD